MTQIKNRTAYLVAGFLMMGLVGCNVPSNQSSNQGGQQPTQDPTTATDYSGHIVFVGDNAQIYTMRPDERTGALTTLFGTPVLNNGGTPSLSLVLSPNKNFLFVTSNSKGVFMEYGMPNENGLLPTAVTLNPASISTNYDADALAFDGSNNLFVHYAKSISPFDEKIAKMAFNETSNTFSFIGYVTTGLPDFGFSQSATLLDLTYFLNQTSDRIDMYQDGSLTSYSTFMSFSPNSIVIK